ncbi:GNAT family N-acetyltransferase [Shewanella spartinae]|uniref:GNAT family N-acetyltransferase n=1 Tax=Shewanella spartinae TaxID=2864205 RepID=UPI0021AC8CF7|nr:GNAT family N-acetyltransferase [Shewanella spartinae]
MPDYSITTDKDAFDFDVIYGFISQSYWAMGIPKETMRRAIANSLCFGVFDKDNKQVGFARLITDSATFAYLADVFILPSHRGKGLSKYLMETIVAHPDLQGLRRIVLATRDAHGLYAQYGFQPIENPEILMQIWHPNVYQREQIAEGV